VRERKPSGEFEEAVRRRLRGIWPATDDERPDDGPPVLVDLPDPVPGPASLSVPAGRAVLGAFDPGRRGVRALVVVAAVVALGAGYLAWRAQPHAEPVPVPTVAPGGVPAQPLGQAPSGQVPPLGQAPGGSDPTAGIVVAVTGRVRHPGLVHLPAGARVADAIDAAGGVLPGTDLSFVNLARRLTDGELLVIGVTPPPGVALGGVAGATGPGGSSVADGKVNLNTATPSELDALPGIGPALAQNIIDYRTAHGGFRSVNELRQVDGIGDAKFAQLKDRVTV
jgi:competence protein ComEA